MNILELEKSYVKALIKDTIETYSGDWRFIHEAVQNSHDNIQLNDNITEGKIDIDLYVASNVVKVKDNGTGIPVTKFKDIVLIGGGDKRNAPASLRKVLKGSQGVGIKSTLFTSTSFKVETVHDGSYWKHQIDGCHNFEEPAFNVDLEIPETQASDLPSGTTLTYSLADYTVQDFINTVAHMHCEETMDVDNQVIKTVDEFTVALESYFRTRTYLGCVQSMLGINPELKPINVSVTLHFDSTDATAFTSIEPTECAFVDGRLYGKRITHEFPAKYLDAVEIYATVPRLEKVDKVYSNFQDVLKYPPDATKRKLLIQKFDSTQIKSLLNRVRKNSQTQEVEFVEEQNRLQRHRSVLANINGMYLVVGQKPYLAKYFHIGQKQAISVNGLPTDIALQFPSGAVPYLGNVHLVLDVNYSLGFGKRNLASRAKGAIDAFFLEAWNMLRRAVPLIVGERAGADQDEMQTWDKTAEFEYYSEVSNMFRGAALSLKTMPREEQEVIALFFDLIGRGTLKGYFPFRLGSRTMYDGLFYIDKSEGEALPSNLRASNLRCVEFKYCISGLLQDLDNEIKVLGDIDLLVCWKNDITDENPFEYSIHALARDEIEPYPGAQLRIKKGTKTCQVLVLKDFLESKNLIKPPANLELSKRAE